MAVYQIDRYASAFENMLGLLLNDKVITLEATDVELGEPVWLENALTTSHPNTRLDVSYRIDGVPHPTRIYYRRVHPFDETLVLNRNEYGTVDEILSEIRSRLVKDQVRLNRDGLDSNGIGTIYVDALADSLLYVGYSKVEIVDQ